MHLVCIQAGIGFGKTICFELCMYTSKYTSCYRIVNCVFVPYKPLAGNMINRLSKMVVKDLSKIVYYENSITESVLDADIFVGTYDQLNDPRILHIMNDWYKLFSNIKLD